MTHHPDFTFSEKTGELSRGDRAMALSARQAQAFAVLRSDQYVETDVVADRIGTAACAVGPIIRHLKRKIAGLGLSIEAQRFSGYRLIVGDMPSKWEPAIPPPVTLDHVRAAYHQASERLTEQQEQARRQRLAAYDQRDLTGCLCGDPPRGFSALDRQRVRQ